MTVPIPKAALWLGLAGLLPFLLGAGTVLSANLYDLTRWTIGHGFIGSEVALSYGLIILCLMSGVLWGFASRGEAFLPYALAVIPALWVFFAVGIDEVWTIKALILGYLLVLALDIWFWNQRLAPPWWLHLRVPLTAVVVLCLAVILNA